LFTILAYFGSLRLVSPPEIYLAAPESLPLSRNFPKEKAKTNFPVLGSIFIFFKFPALKLSHKLAGLNDDLPFGVIFAILMCSMMMGSMIYNYIINNHTSITPNKLLVVNLSVAAASLFIPVLFRDERVTFWCFCIFEICCGIYFPLMAYQKGKIIDDSVRANVYGLMRVPLNCFVVLILSTTREGKMVEVLF
jgi:MFS transporter, MFS domain-containing protein family, molybdate-anion transporter